MARKGGKLDGGQLLQEIARQNPNLGVLLQQIIDGVNVTARNAAVSAVGQVDAPPAPDAVQVKTAGEHVHVSITHNGPIQRGIRYFTEASTSPSFSAPIVIDHGTSRTSHPFPLPTNDDTGAAHKWYFRSYAQYPGSRPSRPTVYGGVNSPLAVSLTGSTSLTLLPATGSGTAAANGQQGGHGLGKWLERPTAAPKRGK